MTITSKTLLHPQRDCADSDSTQFITDVKAAGSNPLMTMVMLPWVAKSAETSTQQGTGPNNFHWSFSVAKYGAQCSVDQFNSDAGNGIVAGTCNNNPPTYLAADPNDAYFPLLDQPGTGDPARKRVPQPVGCGAGDGLRYRAPFLRYGQRD